MITTFFDSDDINVLRSFLGAIHAVYPTVQILVYGGETLTKDIIDEINLFQNTRYENAKYMPEDMIKSEDNPTPLDRE